jgi:hypothetical protein
MNDRTPHARGAPPIQRTTSIFADGPVKRKSSNLEPIGPYVTAELERIFRAMVLAPRVEVADALLRGESVPVEELDPEWVARLGWKP